MIATGRQAVSLADSKPFRIRHRHNVAAMSPVIGDTNGFRRTVELPLAVETRLADVMSYEIDRPTPLRAK